MVWYPLNQNEEVEIESNVFLSNRSRRTEYQHPKFYNHRTNPILSLKFSYHAQLRAAQRGLSTEDIVYILQYGQCYRAADAIFYLLLSKGIPEHERHKMSRLIGTAVIVSKDHSTIISCWRNRQKGTRNIRCKLVHS
jgi:hypothetical protein